MIHSKFLVGDWKLKITAEIKLYKFPESSNWFYKIKYGEFIYFLILDNPINIKAELCSDDNWRCTRTFDEIKIWLNWLNELKLINT